MIEAVLVRRAVGALGAACLLSWFAAPAAIATAPSASALARHTATEEPVVGPEHPVSRPIEGAAPGQQSSPHIAFDGTNYLVVWTDDRTYGQSGYDVYGARVAPDGTVLDPAGIPIATGVGSESPPRVAFGGGTFLVVWTIGAADDTEVAGTRVDPSGVVLDPSGIPIASMPGNQFGADVAFGDGNFLVVWTDSPAAGVSSDVYGTRIDPSGSVVAPSRIPISTAPGAQYSPAVAFGASSFLVAWTDRRFDPAVPEVFGARVNPSGTVLDPSGIAIATAFQEEGPPAIAFNGTDHLVVWQSYRSPRWGIVGARVSPSGTVLDPAGITISRMSDVMPGRPMPAALGTTFLVAWSEVRTEGPADVRGSRIDAEGANLDPAGFVIAGSVAGRVSDVGLASDGSNYFATWEDTRIGPPHIFGAPIRPDGSVLGPGTLVSRAANSQGGSDIAFDGTNYLVVWNDNRSGNTDEVFAARLSPSGRRLDPTDIPVSRGAPGAGPAVTFDGENFIVVWSATSQFPTHVVAARVTPLGHLDGGTISLPDLPFPQILLQLDVAASAGGFLVTWAEGSRIASVVRAVRVNTDGVVLDPVPIEIGSPAGGASVASDGHDFLISWRRLSAPTISIRGTRVTAEGQVLDPGGFVISSGSNPQDPALAWNGQRYLVVWSNNPADYQFDILGARVGPDGTVQDPVPLAISTAPGNQREPVVAANGPFLVAWRETDEADVHDVRGTRVGDDGAVLDVPGISIATSDDFEGAVTLTGGPGPAWGASYTRFVPEPPYGSSRVFLRNVAPK